MAKGDQVVTVSLPEELVSRMEAAARAMERSKDWIVRQAVSEWLAEEHRRHELTLQGLKDIDEGRIFSQEEVRAWLKQRKIQRR